MEEFHKVFYNKEGREERKSKGSETSLKGLTGKPLITFDLGGKLQQPFLSYFHRGTDGAEG